MEEHLHAKREQCGARELTVAGREKNCIAVSSPTTAARSDDVIVVQPRKESTAGGLNVMHRDLPGNTLAYLSCEGVVFGEPAQSTPLFEVQIADDPQSNGVHWKREGGEHSYTWRYDNGIQVEFRGSPQASGLCLYYKVKNTSESPLKRVIVHTCIPTTEAPSFFSEFQEGAVHEEGKTGNYMGFYDRAFLWYGEKRFSIGQSEKGRDEIHLSFTRKGQPPVEWGWWVNGPETFDVPLIAVQSKDGAFTTALGFESAEWASCNGGDDRACFHLFPLFGDLQPGESREVRGCFYLMRGTPEDVLKTFMTDFAPE